jgi:hypothetical protein
MAKTKWIVGLLLAGLITGSVGFADGDVIQFSEIEKAINENNRQIQQQIADTELLRLQKETLDEQKESMESLSPLMGSLSSLLGGQTAWQLISLTEYVPAQLDMGIKLSEKGEQITRNSVILGARQLVMGIMQSQQAMRRLAENVENQQANWERVQISFERGMATETDRFKAQADLEEAKLKLERAKMDKKDYTRRLNQLMGKPIESELYFLREQVLQAPLLAESTYLQSADQERFEIVQLQELLVLKDQEIGLYDTYGLRDDASLSKVYNRLKVEREQLVLQLNEAKEDISVEVKTAYRKAVIANQQQIAIAANRDAKRIFLANLKKQRQEGFVSDAVFEGTENGLKELEEGADLVSLQYNTARMALDFASGVGPSAGIGVTP